MLEIMDSDDSELEENVIEHFEENDAMLIPVYHFRCVLSYG